MLNAKKGVLLGAVLLLAAMLATLMIDRLIPQAIEGEVMSLVAVTAICSTLWGVLIFAFAVRSAENTKKEDS